MRGQGDVRVGEFQHLHPPIIAEQNLVPQLGDIEGHLLIELLMIRNSLITPEFLPQPPQNRIVSPALTATARSHQNSAPVASQEQHPLCTGSLPSQPATVIIQL